MLLIVNISFADYLTSIFVNPFARQGLDRLKYSAERWEVRREQGAGEKKS